MLETTLLAVTVKNDEARNRMLQYRKYIFDFGKYREYHFKNGKGETYKATYKRLLLSSDNLKKMIELNMILPKEYTEDALKAFCKDPSQFKASILLKKQENRNWLMVCIEKRAA